MTPDTKEWRSSSTYDYWNNADVDALAWECLRRNQKYQEDFADIVRTPVNAEIKAEEIGNRWGLRFPRSPKPERSRAARLLDTGN
ncbi:transcriptional regulator domain-containing protein [Pseudaminobacter sp. NGMCC 1.201702]|uniref:transcriptional regulator domain-containing protein n=1 Tax=Pseudaminobacter sp. NGMCC 1.201702 TaxID=3391825 RepID=UPI0039F03F10